MLTTTRWSKGIRVGNVASVLPRTNERFAQRGALVWILPSYGRPEAPGKMLLAPGGMPPNVAVVVNEDDPFYDQYVEHSLREWPPTWHFLSAPPGSRFCEAVRYAYKSNPDRNYYGICDDDYWPVTPGWYDKMIDAAGGTGIAVANDLHAFPRARCRVMGGALARAIGTIAPGKMRHNYSDDTWERFGQVFSIYHPLQDVIVEHRHWTTGKSEGDATYNRGSRDFEEDTRLFKEWLSSDEYRQQVMRVGALFGRTPSVLDPRKVKLIVAVPTHNFIDPLFHHSIAKLQIEVSRAGMGFGCVYSFGGSHIAKVRERVLWNAIAQDPTHILFIDDDMGFEPRLVFRLLAADVEFACAVGVQKTEAQGLCCNFYPGKQVLHPVNRFLKVRDVGFAFVLLKRCVIDKMVAAYPELAYKAGEGKEHALFLDMIDGAERLSEDYSFCRRWTAIGGEIWADRYAKLIHAGRKEYTGSIDEFFQGKEDVNLDVIRANHR